MDTNKTTASSGMLEGAEYEKKLKQYYGDMLVYKSSANSKFFSALSLPSFMRDWLVMRFSNSEGVINKQEVSDYVKRVIPKKEQWNEYLVDLLHNDQTARFLAKVKIDFDAKTKTALFSLPDFEVPKKKGEAIVDWDVIEANRDYLLSPTEVWGIVEIDIEGTTNLVSVATANNEIGTIQPIKKLAEIAHRNGAFFHTDAVQAIGHIPIDVNELNVDLLSASAHKFNGPKGIGFLYVREGTPILPLLNGGAQENSLRAGTENVASIVGMATALSMNCSQIQKSQNHSAKMVELICSILNDAEVDYIRNGYSNGLKGTLNLSFRGKDGEAILHRLDLRGILVSTGSACDSNSVQVSHVIKAINVPDSDAKGTIRISLGKDNTIEEAKIIGETLVSVLMEQK